MIRSRPLTILGLVAVPAVALVVAGCGGGSSNSTASPSATPPKLSNGRSATVGVANDGVGRVLVNSKGLTIYLFKKDAGTKSACFGDCASNWPPVRVSGKPTAGSGVKASLLGTTKRSDGKPQATYNGHPLYLFQGDQNPGDTNGQAITAFGAAWYALSPAGNQVTTKSSSTGSTNGY
jgi:predicted lipoprotein with Yx(FWY)xxD motif